jgi:hypothetical protein
MRAADGATLLPGPGISSIANAAEVDPCVFPHAFAHTLRANHVPNAAINPTPLREYAFEHMRPMAKDRAIAT